MGCVRHWTTPFRLMLRGCPGVQASGQPRHDQGGRARVSHATISDCVNVCAQLIVNTLSAGTTAVMISAKEKAPREGRQEVSYMRNKTYAARAEIARAASKRKAGFRRP